MAPEPRIMVLSASVGAGHVRAAEAVLRALQMKGVESSHIDVLKYTSRIFRKLYSDLYIELVNKNPGLLGILYDALDRPWKYQRRRLALDRLNTRPLLKLLREERPSFALCTHFLPAELLMYLRRKGELDIPVGVVITDFDSHAMWLYKGVDLYFVAHEETKEHLARLGIPPDSVHVTGIPIDPDFDVKYDKAETRLSLGLDPGLRTVLISAGGVGVGPVEELVKEVLGVNTPIQCVVICGRNEVLKERLSGLGSASNPVKVMGYTTEMQRWMAASDLLVGKAGGLTSSEALASGLVLVIVNPVPGQEERNSDHLLEEGAAIRCNNLPVLSYKIDSLLSDTERFKRMRENATRLARPDSAIRVASLALKRLALG